MPSLEAGSCAKQYLESDMMTALCSIFGIHYYEQIDNCPLENNLDLGQCKLACCFLKSYLMQLLPSETFSKLLAESSRAMAAVAEGFLPSPTDWSQKGLEQDFKAVVNYQQILRMWVEGVVPCCHVFRLHSHSGVDLDISFASLKSELVRFREEKNSSKEAQSKW